MKGSRMMLHGLVAVTVLAGGSMSPVAAGEPELCECRDGLEMASAPWIRLMPGDSTGGYFELRNAGDRDYRIVAAESPISEVVELHEHAHVDGVMRMRQVEGLDVPAGATLVLEPGGLHLMLIGLHEPLTAGDWIPVVLEFVDGETMTIHARVQRSEDAREGTPESGHGGMHHGH